MLTDTIQKLLSPSKQLEDGIIIDITQEDLKGIYTDGYSCPLHIALKRNNIHVNLVGANGWIYTNDLFYPSFKAINVKVNDVLLDKSFDGEVVDRLRGLPSEDKITLTIKKY